MNEHRAIYLRYMVANSYSRLVGSLVRVTSKDINIEFRQTGVEDRQRDFVWKQVDLLLEGRLLFSLERS